MQSMDEGTVFANGSAEKATLRRSSSGAKIISGTAAGDRALREMSGNVRFMAPSSSLSSFSSATSVRDAMNKQPSVPTKSRDSSSLGLGFAAPKATPSSASAALSRWSSGSTSKVFGGGAGFGANGNLGIMPSGITTKSLFEAATSGDLSELRKLLDGGGGRMSSKPDVNSCDTQGKTALMCAAASGNASMVEYLLQKRADVKAVDKAHMTSLHHASQRPRTRRGTAEDAAQSEIVKLLVRHRAAVEAKDHNGCSALMAAVVQGDEAVAMSLLNARADVLVRDSEGQSSLDYAVSFQLSGLVQMLQEAQKIQATHGLEPVDGWAPLEQELVMATDAKTEILISSDDTDNLSGQTTPAMLSPPRATDDSISKPALFGDDGKEQTDAGGAIKVQRAPALVLREPSVESEEEIIEHCNVGEKEAPNEETEPAVEEPDEPEQPDEKTQLLTKLLALISAGENGHGPEAHLKELKTALKAAQAAGVEGKEIEDAEAHIKEFKEREKATEKLRTAIAERNVGKLPKAIARAEEAKVPQSVIDEANAVLEEEEGPGKKARASLEAALEAGSTKKLKKAIAAARAVNLPEAEMEQFEQALVGFEARDKAEAELRTAMEERSVSLLKKAIKHATKAGVDSQLIQDAEAIQAEEKPKQKARDELVAAEESADLGLLRDALEKAKSVSLASSEIQKYDDLVKRLEAKNNASETLQSAMQSINVADLKSAIQLAAEAGVDAELIAAAEQIVKEEEPKEKAREQLAAACELCTIAALREAIQAAQEANLDASEYGQALDLLHREEEKERSIAAVKKTLEDTNQVDLTSMDSLKDAKEKLGNAIQSAARAGVGESDLSEAEKRRKKLHNAIEDLKGSIRVFCRVRPLSSKEKDDGDTTVTGAANSMTLAVNNDGQETSFIFDAVFTPGTQDEVFEDCRDLVQSAVDGYNVTMFAYGQTGAGKTFTMYGAPGNEGTAPRTIRELYRVMEEGRCRCDYTVSASMLELYRNELIDLLCKAQSGSSSKLSIRRDKSGAVEVENLTEEECQSAEQLSSLLERGNEQRTVAATAMNSESSRSHLVLMIKILSVNRQTKERLRGKILICDLAGSERIKKSQVTEHMQQEAIQINKSLTALGDVIEALTKSQKMIPYRNHKLTELMQDSLGGTAKTLMFVNCSPASSNLEETMMSLKYATRAKKITNNSVKKAV